MLRILTNFSYVSCNEHRITLYFETAFKGYEMHASGIPFYTIAERSTMYLKGSQLLSLRRHSRDKFMQLTDSWEALDAM